MTKDKQFGQQLQFLQLDKNFITANLPKLTKYLISFIKDNSKMDYGTVDISIDLSTASILLNSTQGTTCLRTFKFYNLTLDNASRQAKNILTTYYNYLKRKITTEKSLTFNDLVDCMNEGNSILVLPNSFTNYLVQHLDNPEFINDAGFSSINTPIIMKDNGYFGQQLLKHWHCYQQINTDMLAGIANYASNNDNLSLELSVKLFRLVVTNTYQLVANYHKKIDYYVLLCDLANKVQQTVILPLASIVDLNKSKFNLETCLPRGNTIFIYKAIDKFDAKQLLAQLFDDSIWSDKSDRKQHYEYYQSSLQSSKIIINLDKAKPYIIEIRHALQTNFTNIEQFVYVDHILELLLNKSE